MKPVSFIHSVTYEQLPADVVAQAKRCLLDLIGVAVSGRQTELSRIVHDFAYRQMGAGEGGARLLFDGRRVSATGAAYAGASTIDSIDAHDGHRLTKGHAGVALMPALFAMCDADGRWDGRECITALAMGYEIATRAGIALHASVSDYHTSGAWNALGCAAIAARHLRLSETQTLHALGIAEYHGPRSQMMRVIDHPTMLKDGSGMGAMTGVSAALLAADGFTGAPAILLDENVWGDLRERWMIREQYFKPQPVCRWAQPAMEAAGKLMRARTPDPGQIARIEVKTFAHAARLGAAPPQTTEQAQYALGFPVAAMIARGQVGAAEVTEGWRDPAILDVLSRVTIAEDAAMSARFPAERFADVSFTLRNGDVASSGWTAPRGDPESPLSGGEMDAKFYALASAIGDHRAQTIAHAIAHLDTDPLAIAALADAVFAPLQGEAAPRLRGARA